MSLSYLGDYSRAKDSSEEALSLEKKAYGELAETTTTELSSINQMGTELSTNTYAKVGSTASNKIVKIPVEAYVEETEAQAAQYEAIEQAQAATSRINGEVGYKAIESVSTATSDAGSTTTVKSGGVMSVTSIGRAVKGALTAFGLKVAGTAESIVDKVTLAANSLYLALWGKDNLTDKATSPTVGTSGNGFADKNPYLNKIYLKKEGEILKSYLPEEFVKNVYDIAQDLGFFKAVSYTTYGKLIPANSTVTITLNKVSAEDFLTDLVGSTSSPLYGYTLSGTALTALTEMANADYSEGVFVGAYIIAPKYNASNGATVSIVPILATETGTYTINNTTDNPISYVGVGNGDDYGFVTMSESNGKYSSSGTLLTTGVSTSYGSEGKLPLVFSLDTSGTYTHVRGTYLYNVKSNNTNVTSGVFGTFTIISGANNFIIGGQLNGEASIGSNNLSTLQTSEDSGNSEGNEAGFINADNIISDGESWESAKAKLGNTIPVNSGAETAIPIGLPENSDITQPADDTGDDARTGEAPDTSTDPDSSEETYENGTDDLNNNIEEGGETLPDTPIIPDNNVDVVTTPSYPPYNGMWLLYNPTQAETQSLAGFLWSDTFIDAIKKLTNDPMEAVINFYRLYATPETLSSEYDIILGNVDSGVKSKVCASQYLTINCGSVNVREVYQNALDYTATQFSLYLPFIGFVAMNNRDFMNGTVNITYKIDLLTGTCVALVKAIRGSTNTIIGQYVGDASEKIPLTATSARAMLQGMASLALGVARTMGGDPGGVALGIGGAVRAGQTPIEMSGSIQGNAGALGYKKPYVVIRRNNTTGSGWSNIGLPSNTVTTVSQTSGRVVMTDMTIPGGMTQEEEQEIKDLFARGVIV